MILQVETRYSNGYTWDPWGGFTTIKVGSNLWPSIVELWAPTYNYFLGPILRKIFFVVEFFREAVCLVVGRKRQIECFERKNTSEYFDETTINIADKRNMVGKKNINKYTRYTSKQANKETKQKYIHFKPPSLRVIV